MSRLKHRGSGKLYYGGLKLVDKYQSRLDQAARDYNRTKDEKYKKLWYDLVRKVDNGTYYSKRRTIPTDISVKTNIGWNSVDKRH